MPLQVIGHCACIELCVHQEIIVHQCHINSSMCMHARGEGAFLLLFFALGHRGWMDIVSGCTEWWEGLQADQPHTFIIKRGPLRFACIHAVSYQVM
ncbi:unnamed protein product [Periconia digitata]|uniref:Uncharacterized protein n=1 Tax=Periconia digitata TaxID=1303443 RepID=A0A9W4UB35_9PLEO|nr:unnamed protein product [Periconia digitata]